MTAQARIRCWHSVCCASLVALTGPKSRRGRSLLPTKFFHDCFLSSRWLRIGSKLPLRLQLKRPQGILRAAAFDLSSLAENVAERLHLRGTQFVVAKTGGMIGRSKYLESQIDERLRKAFPQAEIGGLRVSPAEAAAQRAMQMLSGGDSAGH